MYEPSVADEAAPRGGPPPSIGPVEEHLRRFARFAGEHAGLATSLIPLIAAGLFVLRSYAVARFNPNVSLDLIMLSNPSDVFRQIGVTAFQLIAFLGSMYGIALLGEGWRFKQYSRVLAGGIPGLVLLLWLTLVSIPDAGPILLTLDLLPPVAAFGWGYTGTVLAGEGGSLIPRMRSTMSRAGAAVTLLIGAALVYLFSAYSGIWRPAEMITIAGGTPQTLYVLNEPGNDLIIFDAQRAKIFRVAASQVTARQFCVQSGYVTHGMQRCP